MFILKLFALPVLIYVGWHGSRIVIAWIHQFVMGLYPKDD